MIQYQCPACGHADQCGDFMSRLAIHCKKCYYSIQLPCSPTVTSVAPVSPSSLSAKPSGLAENLPTPPAGGGASPPSPPPMGFWGRLMQAIGLSKAPLESRRVPSFGLREHVI